MSCPLCHTLSRIRARAEPSHIADLSESSLALADTQGCPGWCVLVLNTHDEHLESLDPTRRVGFLADLARAAGAVRSAFPDATRLNYACLCNVVPHLHWHLIPRRATDLPGAVWSWPEESQRGRATNADRMGLGRSIRAAL